MYRLSDSVVKARKAHRDDAYYLIREYFEDGFYTYSELREIAKVSRQGGKILPGQQYRRLVSVDAGQIYVWRESLPLSDLLHKYDLYEVW